MRRVALAFAAATLLAAVPASAGLISITNNTTGLFDASSGNRLFGITGLEPGYGSGIVTSVTISIDFAKADGESFDPPFPGGTPFYNEIHFALTSPNATTIQLIAAGSWGSGSGQFNGVITFDDLAAQVVNFGAAPVAGTFRPTGPGSLADFMGGPALGNWTLFIEDTVGADALRFHSATLNVTTDTAVPEPTTMVLLGSGVAALIARRRRS
jgi:hypothetical protein